MKADITLKGTRYRRSFPTDIEAAAWKAEMKKRVYLGEPVNDLLPKTAKEKTACVLRGLADETLLLRWEGTANERGQLSNVKNLLKHFGEFRDVSSITSADINQYIKSERDRGRAPATINRRLSCLSAILDHGVDSGVLSSKPKVKSLPTSNERLSFFSEKDERDILATLTDLKLPAFRAFFVWLVDTGMRPSEARALTSKSLREDKTHGSVVDLVETKNKTARSLWLTPRAYESFSVLSQQDPESPFKRFTPQVIATNWAKVRRALGKVGDAEFVFYLTRHTCASRLVQRGVSLLAVKDWMGHKNMQMTLRYAKLSPTNTLEARDALAVTTMDSIPPTY